MIILIALYLTAIVAANLAIAHFGANVAVSFVASFVFIALDLTTAHK